MAATVPVNDQLDGHVGLDVECPYRICASETFTAPAHLARTGTLARDGGFESDIVGLSCCECNDEAQPDTRLGIACSPARPRPTREAPRDRIAGTTSDHQQPRHTQPHRLAIIPSSPSSRTRSQQRGPDHDLPPIAGMSHPPSTRLTNRPTCTDATSHDVIRSRIAPSRRLRRALMGPNMADAGANSAEQEDSERRLDDENGAADIPLSGRTFTNSTLHRESLLTCANATHAAPIPAAGRTEQVAHGSWMGPNWPHERRETTGLCTKKERPPL